MFGRDVDQCKGYDHLIVANEFHILVAVLSTEDINLVCSCFMGMELKKVVYQYNLQINYRNSL